MDNVVEAVSLLKKYVDLLESRDPQFKAVKRVAERWGIKALPAVIANALVSYRLSGTGERYWTEFADFFENSEPTLENFEAFLKGSKYNKALLERKIRRVRKVWRKISSLREGPLNLNNLRDLLSLSLNAKGNEKTIVFALKMTYYFFKALGEEVEGDSPLPIDLRIAALTCASGLMRAPIDEIMGKLRGQAIRKWEDVAKRAEVKMLNLDAILWLPMRGVKELLVKGDLEGARDRFARNLISYGVDEEDARRSARLLLLSPCKNFARHDVLS